MLAIQITVFLASLAAFVFTSIVASHAGLNEKGLKVWFLSLVGVIYGVVSYTLYLVS